LGYPSHYPGIVINNPALAGRQERHRHCGWRVRRERGNYRHRSVGRNRGRRYASGCSRGRQLSCGRDRSRRYGSSCSRRRQLSCGRRRGRRLNRSGMGGDDSRRGNRRGQGHWLHGWRWSRQLFPSATGRNQQQTGDYGNKFSK
jgi:hypothetical protein